MAAVHLFVRSVQLACARPVFVDRIVGVLDQAFVDRQLQRERSERLSDGRTLNFTIRVSECL